MYLDNPHNIKYTQCVIHTHTHTRSKTERHICKKTGLIAGKQLASSITPICKHSRQVIQPCWVFYEIR